MELELGKVGLGGGRDLQVPCTVLLYVLNYAALGLHACLVVCASTVLGN
jgi:hypothetical protein